MQDGWLPYVLLFAFEVMAVQQIWRPVYTEPELRAKSRRRGYVWAVVGLLLFCYSVFLAPLTR